MIISMSIDPHKALQYQSSSQKEKWILLSEIIQTLDRVQPQKKETSFFTQSCHATNLLNSWNYFWDLKSNQYKLKYNQVLL